MRIVTAYGNFSRGKVDHDLMGRYDLPIYQSGSDLFQNCISNFKGNAIYRTGFEEMEVHEDCVFVEFKFNNSQNYLLVFYLNKIRFLSYDTNGVFGWVLNGGATPLEVSTPYTLAQARDLDFTQNADTMVFTHKDFEPYKLIRTAANAFTFAPFARKADPFPLTWQATKAITGITQATNANLTIVAHGYSVGDRILISGVTGMTQINTYTARIVTVPGANNVTIDVDTTLFTAYTANGTAAKVLTGDYPACCLYYKGRLFYAASRLRITTLFASNSGLYDDYTLTPVTDASALIITVADISQKIEWLFGGDNSLIAGAADGIVAINGGGVNKPITAATVEANITSAEGCNSSYPLKKDGLVFYVGRNNRNMYYFKYDILSESFQGEDANFVSYDITEGGLGKIRQKKDRNDLIFSVKNGNLVSLNFKQLSNELIEGWHEHTGNGTFLDIAVLADNNGDPQLFALVKYGSAYYIERQGEYVEFAERVNFFTGSTAADKLSDDDAYIRYVAEQLKQVIYLDNSNVVSNLQSNLITFSGGDTITATSAVFSNGDVGKHIVYKTATGYESGRFLITEYSSTTVVKVEVLQTPTANTYTNWYLTFNTISGLSQYNGTTIGVVTDGGYLDDFAVSGGAISLGSQVTHAVLGYRYKGIIKSFCLGFQLQGENTQITMKAITQAGVRCIATAGGEFGSSLYRLQPIQELGQNDLNYLPPIPIDGTKMVSYSDDNTQDKFLYIVQDAPLPMTICSMIINANYTRAQ